MSCIFWLAFFCDYIILSFLYFLHFTIISCWTLCCRLLVKFPELNHSMKVDVSMSRCDFLLQLTAQTVSLYFVTLDHRGCFISLSFGCCHFFPTLKIGRLQASKGKRSPFLFSFQILQYF